MTPDQILQGGAVAVFVLVFVAAVRGDLRFKPGVSGELEAKDKHIAYLAERLQASDDNNVKLVAAVDKLGDALEARNRRDERNRRTGQ